LGERGDDGDDEARRIVVLAAAVGGEDEAKRVVWKTICSLRAIGQARRVVIVTRGGARVLKGERVKAGQAAVWGLGRSARVEYANLGVVNVDVESVEDLERELEASGDGSAFECAYRGKERWVPRLEEVARAEKKKTKKKEKRLRSYLVTGGFGGLARAVLGWIGAESGTEKTVLVGRGGATEDHGGLLQGGMEMRCVRADAGSAGSFKGLMGAMGKVEGLFHLAGVSCISLLRNARHCEVQRVFSSKLSGLSVTSMCSFGVFFSSQSTLVPMFGQGVYCAANSALEAFVSDTSTSLCWSGFAERGMYTTANESLHVQESSFFRPLDSAFEVPHFLDTWDFETQSQTLGLFDMHWKKLPFWGKSIFSHLQVPLKNRLVVIVGAGLQGLAAARFFAKAGIRVLGV
jgi:hypothetical protein